MADGVLGVIELQQQRQQQILQRAQLELQQTQAAQAAEDRQFTQDLSVINADWVSPEDKLQIINSRIAPKLKLVGPVTMDGIAPFRSLMNELTTRKRKGQSIDDLQGQIEYFSANPKFVAPQEMPALIQAQEQVREGKIAQVVPQPVTPDPVRESRQRLNDYGPLLQVASQNDFADQYMYTTAALGRRAGMSGEEATALEKQYPDVSPLISQLRQDQAVHQLDVLQKQDVERTRQLLRSNPSMIAKALEGKLEEAGFSADPVKNMQMSVLKIRQKPFSEWTEAEKGQVQGWAKSVATAEQAAEVGVLFAKMEAPIAQAEYENSQKSFTMLNQTQTVDKKAQDAIREVDEIRTDVLKDMDGKTTVTDQESAAITGKAQNYATQVQAGEQAYKTAVAPQVEAYDALMKKANERLATMQQRLVQARGPMKDALGTGIQDAKLEVGAYEASHRLLLEYNPYEIEILRGAAVQAQLEKKPEEVAKLNTLITQKEAGRKKDLETVSTYQLRLLDKAERAGKRATELEGTMKKQDALVAASRYVLNQRQAEKTSWTAAITDAANKFGVPLKDLADQTEYLRKNEDVLNLTDAQAKIGQMAEAWQIQHKEWPDHTQTMKMANVVMKQYPGLKREDIVKGLERGSAGGGGLDSKDLQKSYGDVISLAARLSGNSGIQIGQGEGGIPEISIGSVKDPVKLADMMETIANSQSYLNKDVQTALKNTIKVLRGGKTSEGRPIVQNPDGSISTERTITVTDPRLNGGKPTNIPSMFGGKQVSEQEAINRIVQAGGKDPETGQALQGFNTIREAVTSAQQRSADLGKKYANKSVAPPTAQSGLPTAPNVEARKQTLRERYGLAGRPPARP